eukprot:35461-Pyramimonas_sp.AAC.1
MIAWKSWAMMLSVRNYILADPRARCTPAADVATSRADDAGEPSQKRVRLEGPSSQPLEHNMTHIAQDADSLTHRLE